MIVGPGRSIDPSPSSINDEDGIGTTSFVQTPPARDRSPADAEWPGIKGSVFSEGVEGRSVRDRDASLLLNRLNWWDLRFLRQRNLRKAGEKDCRKNYPPHTGITDNPRKFPKRFALVTVAAPSSPVGMTEPLGLLGPPNPAKRPEILYASGEIA